MDEPGIPTADEMATRQSRQELRLRLLELEYSALRSEMSSLLVHRLQAPTALAAAAGLVIGFAPSATGLPLSVVIWISAALAALGVLVWMDSGWTIGRLSGQLAQLEQDLNDVVAGKFSSRQVLSWETSRQGGNVFRVMSYGPGRQPIPRRK